MYEPARQRPHRNAAAHSLGRLETYLADLAARTAAIDRPVPLPHSLAPARQISASEDLRDRFRDAAVRAGAAFTLVCESELTATLLRLLAERGAHSIYVAPGSEGILQGSRRAALLDALARSSVRPLSEPDEAALFDVPAALTGVAWAIAETGTIVCTAGLGLPRLASLAPPLHVALVGASQILPDLLDLFAALSDAPQLAANITLITGPSKTADIEGILVTGVHGPGEVHLMVVSDL